MTEPLRIALAGLGTVGAGVVRLLDTRGPLIARRAGRPIEIVAVSARDRTRDRGIDVSRFAWVDDTTALAARDDVDVVVELIGGSDGPALVLADRTLAGGKALVTANKAMIAHHGVALAALAEAHGVALRYEAAVAGGVPVVKALREGTAANAVAAVSGILNGTCNYILTRMEREGSDFAAVLADAQALGFAEADPSFDIDGVDAAHKLAILASLAFGTRVDFAGVAMEGVRHVQAGDIAQARALGYCIRLVGLAQADTHGLFQRVAPCLVPLAHPLAHVLGPMNAVVVDADPVGQLFFSGAGAGEGPTASAVVADLIDIARGSAGCAFGMPVAQLGEATRADAGARRGRHYLRLSVADKPGVLAEITAAMRDAGVSIESMIQRGIAADGGVFVVMTTHEGPAQAIDAALDRLEDSPSMCGRPMRMPILG